MEFTIVFLVLTGSILFGLIRSTESVLEIRQRRRDQGDDPKVYL
jgi:hypothetical protein